ncbi:sugar porter family MFS transporter [Thioclava sp. GXIMD2076]|uniref:Sugar porter family MFS transporter n=1 Tax=Thioclava kandeliae TaxID=3070818 RepID=A0ABV1SEA8_9RHOB
MQGLAEGHRATVQARSDDKGILGRVALVATMGGLLYGYDTGVINGALIFIQRDLGLTPVTEGMAASALLLGAGLGAIGSGPFSMRIGRRRTILLLSVIFILATLACVLSPNVASLVAARFVLGVAVGGSSVTVPTYLAEVAPSGQRGRLVTRNELMLVSGQLLAFAFNAAFSVKWGDNPEIWRWMLSVAMIPAIALFIGMFFVPESPRWLVAHNKIEKAERALKRLHSDEDAAIEIRELRKAVDEDAATRRARPSRLDLGRFREPWIRRILMIGIGIGIVQQLTGVNSIMYYGTQILTESGFGQNGAFLANISNGVISVAATFLGIYLLPKVDRRTMLTIGLCGIVVTLLAIGATSMLLGQSTLRAFIILPLMAAFLGFQQAFVSPVTWVLLSEIFPLKVRSMAVGISGLALWLATFAVGFLFPIMVAGIGLSVTYFVFAAIGLANITFTRKFVPETRGKSLEQVEEMLRAHRVRES